jgi:hypothetical protein
MGLDISLFLRTVASPETFNGKNQLDESWTLVLIMCLGGPNLAGYDEWIDMLLYLCNMVDL